MMFPQSRHSGSSHLPQQLKFTTSDSCDRIKDEFQLLQAQYHSLKLECDKLASEKSEMQRHYVMYYEMSYGLNIEMHKQAEIVKRLNGICAQVLPYLSQEGPALQGSFGSLSAVWWVMCLSVPFVVAVDKDGLWSLLPVVPESSATSAWAVGALGANWGTTLKKIPPCGSLRSDFSASLINAADGLLPLPLEINGGGTLGVVA
ncbi:TLE family member 5 isoform X1 [Pseudopipra pipra]|uniref:TLE family member 5 isoform X1 n=1 Tax=Pseudopipra pipra TaxID=415032 RepID=UPI00313971ED